MKSFKQRMFKVGYGPNLWGIISEDSLDKYDYLEDAIEYVGERELFYVEEISSEPRNRELFMGSDTGYDRERN
jgi:hypothetical protein